MTRDEFAALPPAIALGLIWDVASDRLKRMPCPRVPGPPKYDGRLKRGTGFVWFSELDLDSLEYWWAKNRDGAAAGGEWAERNGKTAATLEKWVAWRRLYPYEQWRGIRGEERAIARMPEREPVVNAWDEKPGGTGKKQQKQQSGAQRGRQPPPAEEDDNGYGF